VLRDETAAMPRSRGARLPGTLDRLIHGYFDVDYEVIWSIITIDLPALMRQLEQALQ
jgi:uncharacterized protein with HEPN domain